MTIAVSKRHKTALVHLGNEMKLLPSAFLSCSVQKQIAELSFTAKGVASCLITMENGIHKAALINIK